jgi:hypothetical protein
MVKPLRQSVYQLKITLAEVKPSVWRRVIVPSSVLLAELHDIVQIAMGWENAHVHQFTRKIPRGEIAGPKSRAAIKTESRIQVDELLLHEKDSLLYEYDFGDGWVHDIVLEKIMPASADLRVPSCVAGARACPPEDCGGAYRYAELQRAIQDASHPEHEETVEWIGDEFDPEFFDLEEVNRQLAPFGGRL